jgi:hypothetical protein
MEPTGSAGFRVPVALLEKLAEKVEEATLNKLRIPTK